MNKAWIHKWPFIGWCVQTSESFQKVLYTGQGRSGYRTYPGYTGYEVGMYSEWDDKLYSLIHTFRIANFPTGMFLGDGLVIVKTLSFARKMWM